MQEQDKAPDDPEDEDDDPTKPGHRDYDLSESAPTLPEDGYSYYYKDRKPWYAQRWTLLIVAILVIFGLLLPYLRIL